MDLDEIVIEDEIRDEEGAIGDIRDFSALAKSNKTVNALKHCNNFLKTYCAREEIQFHRIQEIGYDGIDKKGNLFWDKMIGGFLHYLGSTAKCNFDPKNDGLSYQTATQYASAVKQFVVVKFRLEERISVFRDEQWKILRKQLLSMYKEESRKTGKKLGNGREGSSDDDRVAIGTACIWIGDSRSAQFFALENAKYYAAGRCREISLIEVKDLVLKDVNENGRSFKVLAITVDKDKGKHFGSQKLPLFPHRDHMQQDIYFALAYNVLVTRFVETYVFTDFAERAKKHLQGVTKSNVSQLWRSCFKTLFKQFGELAEQVNLKLGSHHGKKGSNQKLGENPLTAGLPQIFHSGWDVRAAHTLFEYVVGTESMSRQTSKVLSNWTSSVEMQIVGGEPPNIHDIRGEENLKMARVLCGYLFRDDYDSRWSPAIREVLFASTLRFYPDLVKILDQHPTSEYKHYNAHPFMRVLHQALEDVGVNMRQFNDWCVDVRKGFLQRNSIALPIDVLANNGYDGLNEIQVDARSFLTQMNALTRAYIAMSNHAVSIREDVQRVVDRQDKLEEKMDRVIELLESNNNRDNDDEDKRLVYSEAVKNYKPSTPAKLFVSFFKDSLHVLYYNQLKTFKWKSLSKKERDRVTTDFHRKKRCLRYMLCFVASFPSVPPTSGGKPYSDWLKKITLQAEAAERGVLNYWNTKLKKKADKLTFGMMGSVELEDLDARFEERPPEGITSQHLDMFRKVKK